MHGTSAVAGVDASFWICRLSHPIWRRNAPIWRRLKLATYLELVSRYARRTARTSSSQMTYASRTC
jgi:hypothetical protein